MNFNEVTTFQRWLLVSGVLICVSGCGSNGNRVPVFEVEGSVVVDGQPAQHAQVYFHPEDKSQKLFPHGEVDENGTFQLSTYEMNDGAPVGSYLVTIVWQDPPPPGSSIDAPRGPDKLEGMYADKKSSQLRVEIKPQSNQLEPFLLSL